MIKKIKVNIDALIAKANAGPSRWELDNIVWNDRATNSNTLRAFLKRIEELRIHEPSSPELKILESLAQDLDPFECDELLSDADDVVQQNFIENLARIGALEILTNNKISFETMNTMCKLNPTDFILTAKRTQDIVNSIHELVIQGETLSNDVAGA
jgi:hypothetical protein